jgi:hypothetical protein
MLTSYPLRKCVKCGSRHCGPIRCRFENTEPVLHQDSKPDVRDAVRVNAADEKRSTTR